MQLNMCLNGVLQNKRDRKRSKGGEEREKGTFYSPQLLAQGYKISPFHVALPYEPEDLFSCKHRHPLQILSIDPIFFEYLAIATKIYLFQPQANILWRKEKSKRSKIDRKLIEKILSLTILSSPIFFFSFGSFKITQRLTMLLILFLSKVIC